jgi:hypothetical protein
LFYQERATLFRCISSLTKRQELSRACNTKIDQLISNHQDNLPTSRSGIPMDNGGNHSSSLERILLILEDKSLILLEDLIMKTKTLS